jgi:hypothetical protein
MLSSTSATRKKKKKKKKRAAPESPKRSSRLRLTAEYHRGLAWRRWHLAADACRLLQRDVAVLEEPEHLNWFNAKRRWSSEFRHVVGVMHTNYVDYVGRDLGRWLFRRSPAFAFSPGFPRSPVS